MAKKSIIMSHCIHIYVQSRVAGVSLTFMFLIAPGVSACVNMGELHH